jgi:hypothetical protein
MNGNQAYFGFGMPGALPGQNQNPLITPGSSYLGAMPAGLAGPGASPMASVQTPDSLNMQTAMPLAMMGMGLMGAGQQHSAHPQSTGQALLQTGLPIAGLMMQYPQFRQGLMGMLGSGAGGAGSTGGAFGIGVPGAEG